MASDKSAHLSFEDMPPSTGGSASALHIRDLVRETGLRREQLYMWERRYGFLDTLLPLDEAVHDHTVRGDLRMFQQFRYAEVAQRLLRDATRFTRPARESRSVLLATPPNDLNHLGLAMLESLLLMDGINGVILGPGVPLHEIAAAVSAYKTYAVGLVFDHGHAVKVASQQVRSLRNLLPEGTALWV